MILALALLCQTSAFYVPGVAPIDFQKDESVEIKAVKMTSSKTQLPFEYYSLKFCRPQKIEYQSENLGEVLRGDRIVNTPYEAKMNVHSNCQVLCKQPVTSSDVDLLRARINLEYSIHLLADNLPAATKIEYDDQVQYEHGFKLGYTANGKTYLNNHLVINFKYNKIESDSEFDLFRIVGFEVIPLTVADLKSNDDGECRLTQKTQPLELNKKTTDIVFSYSVNWEVSETRWASRWDMYLNEKGDVQIHWFSIVNSLVVVLFLFGIIAMIIIRTVKRDISQYNREDEELLLDDSYEETGWKLVHGDVFRPPNRLRLFIALIGAGMQILFMSVITILVAMLGMLSPSSRGALISTMCFLFVFMGIFAGYHSARLYKSMKGKEWKQTAIMLAILYPSFIFGVCFLLNLFVWQQGSSRAVPFTTMLALLCMWFGISLPLIMIGSFFGFKQPVFEDPVRTNQIPRCVPAQNVYMGPVISLLMAGVLPFGAVFIELFFIFTAIWENEFYYMFGFLFLVFVILAVAVAQIAIVMVYFQLCAEDYHWWWRSFIVSGGSAFYIFLYSIFYFFQKLQIVSFVPIVLYFGYSFLLTVTFWILTGTIGFASAYIFVRKIYAQIKID